MDFASLNVAQESLFWPMGALAFLTFIVLVNIPFRRFAASRAGKVNAGDFRYGESARVPGDVSIPNRNYMNLTELPVLFYVACLMFFVAHEVDVVCLVLAWCYVGLRLVHSLVHLTYNNVFHRLSVFAFSSFSLMLFWGWFFVREFALRVS